LVGLFLVAPPGSFTVQDTLMLIYHREPLP
jgi:hypothetical protein